MQLLDRTLGIRPVQLFDHGPWSCRLPRAYVRSAPAVVLFLTGPCQKHSWHRAPARVTCDRRPAPWLYLDDVPCISENRATSNQLVIHEVWQSTSVPMCSGERGPGERMKFIVWSVETSFGDLARTSGILSLFGYSDVGRWAPSSAMWPSAMALLPACRQERAREKFEEAWPQTAGAPVGSLPTRPLGGCSSAAGHCTGPDLNMCSREAQWRIKLKVESFMKGIPLACSSSCHFHHVFFVCGVGPSSRSDDPLLQIVVKDVRLFIPVFLFTHERGVRALAQRGLSPPFTPRRPHKQRGLCLRLRLGALVS